MIGKFSLPALEAGFLFDKKPTLCDNTCTYSRFFWVEIKGSMNQIFDDPTEMFDDYQNAQALKVFVQWAMEDLENGRIKTNL
ncbi:hypothetical protein A2839_03285 [Candidatus Uhrbacteria bacterium RIFCSPHIGHO2_01_FULL_47_10]|nr:MAG: hypothetical protein A2839_03285 [Candidatus Uhrbacteria bacterium RIFCSPHIGHO2_01_FULL_47_10]